MTLRVLVPRLVDEANLNAQNLNARSLLSRFGGHGCEWHCVAYGRADPAVAANPAVRVAQLAPGRAWPWRLALFYQRRADAIFYPGIEWYDRVGLRWRDWTFRTGLVVATLEGVVGGPERERQLSQMAGHPVYAQHVAPSILERVDYVLRRADHILALSPFLGRVARELYGDKCSVLPMGVDRSIFLPAAESKSARELKVIGVGNVRAHKRPEIFLRLARRFADARFCWIGEGDQRRELMATAAQLRLRNLIFAGALSRRQVAEELRAADIFVMPSRAEGVPKAVQEAAACGLPCVVFGSYETPSVIDGQNGYVVWSVEEMERRVGELLNNQAVRERMGRRGGEMAAAWDWSIVAPQWQRRLLEILGPGLVRNARVQRNPIAAE